MTKYVKQILLIVSLTNIPALLIWPSNLMIAIGWFMGMLASSINFTWLSISIKGNVEGIDKDLGSKSFGGFYLRFLFIAVYSVIVIKFVKPNILAFGAGLLSAQIAIFIHYLLSLISNAKKKANVD
ncbi:MAG: ATP synthase subunit I [Candidatus Cloacimonas sp.]|jgi:hypothetical protein|nr:ATP synthase subunit I [Candidatus Cloacimonadota bacterium]